MTLNQSLTALFKRAWFQRWVYAFMLLLWIGLWFDQTEKLGLMSPIGISFYWIVIVPVVVLFAQLLLNSRVLWMVVVALLVGYTAWALWNIVFTQILLNIHRDYVPVNFWETGKAMKLFINVAALFFMNWIGWRIKPS